MTKAKFIILMVLKAAAAIFGGLVLAGVFAAIVDMETEKAMGWPYLVLTVFLFLVIELLHRTNKNYRAYLTERKEAKRREKTGQVRTAEQYETESEQYRKDTETKEAAKSTRAESYDPETQQENIFTRQDQSGQPAASGTPKSEETPAAAPALDATGDFEAYKNRMTGSLVALFKETHEEIYRSEYLRRLKKLGFQSFQAENFFMFELMILKYDSREPLTDPRYIYRPMFDLKSEPLPEGDDWYIKHQRFLLSEVVKIWDEAEYIWQRQKALLTDEKVKSRILSLTRYGGAKLFIGYLEMMSEHAHTDMALLHAYARAEQDLLYLYRWKEVLEHPYKP